MKDRYFYFVAALFVMDIIDGDFSHISVLDAVKLVLYLLCLIQFLRKGKKT